MASGNSSDLQCECGAKVMGVLEMEEHHKICSDRVCCICLDRMAASKLHPCLHNKFCMECILQVVQATLKCPYCRSIVLQIKGEGVEVFNPALDAAAKLAIEKTILLAKEIAL